VDIKNLERFETEYKWIAARLINLSTRLEYLRDSFGITGNKNKDTMLKRGGDSHRMK